MRALVPPSSDGEVEDLETWYAPPDRRHLRMGFVQSLDGAVTVGGVSRGLQSPADLRVFRALRAVSDAVLVGAGTARREDYGPVRLAESAIAWRAAHGRAPTVPLVVVSRSGGQGLDTSRLPSSTLVLTGTAGARRGDGSFECVIAGDDEVDLAKGLELLATRGLRRLTCEGGPTLFSSLLAHELVDELCLTVSPLLVGGEPHLLRQPSDPPRRLRLLSLLHDDDVLLGRWAVDPPSG